MSKARKKASKKASKKTAKKTRTPAQKRATAALVKRNKARKKTGKKTAKKASKKRASAHRAAAAVPRKRRTTKKAAAHAVHKARKTPRVRVKHHKRADPGTFYGPMPKAAARKARKYSKRGLMTHAELTQSYHKVSAAHPNRVRVAKKHVKKHEVVTAEQVFKAAKRKTGKLAIWMCANPSGRRTGCGGGKRGGHVMGVLR